MRFACDNSAAKLLLAALPGVVATLLFVLPASGEETAVEPQYFVCEMRLGTDPEAQAAHAEALEGHVAYLGQLYDDDVLLIGGPFTDDSSEGILIFQAASLEAAQQIVSGDPSVAAGAMEVLEIHPFWPAFNRAAGESFSVEEMHQMMEQHEAEASEAE